MRASTVGSRFLDRCGDSLGVEISFKDICILAAVLNSRCRSKFGPYLTQDSSKLRTRNSLCSNDDAPPAQAISTKEASRHDPAGAAGALATAATRAGL